MTTKSSERVEADKKVEQAAEAGAEPTKADETVPGGKYIVDGKAVDANGEPFGKKKKEE